MSARARFLIIVAITTIVVATVQQWRHDAQVSRLEAGYATAAAATATAARQQQQDLQAAADKYARALASIELDLYGKLREEQAQNENLRFAAGVGAQRVYVRATCPALPAADVPAGASGAGLGDGTRAELAADARQDYFALRAALILANKQLDYFKAAHAQTR